MAKPNKGKKYVKVIKNTKTWRTKKVSYWAVGYTIAPWTKRWDSYCARSLWIKKEMIAKWWKSAEKARNPNSPNNLSRAKWKCKWAKSYK